MPHDGGVSEAPHSRRPPCARLLPWGSCPEVPVRRNSGWFNGEMVISMGFHGIFSRWFLMRVHGIFHGDLMMNSCWFLLELTGIYGGFLRWFWWWFLVADDGDGPSKKRGWRIFTEFFTFFPFWPLRSSLKVRSQGIFKRCCNGIQLSAEKLAHASITVTLGHERRGVSKSRCPLRSPAMFFRGVYPRIIQRGK